jgi:hypothetical protein
MTQYSWFWQCGTDGDEGNVTLNKMIWMSMVLGNTRPASDGIIYWTSTLVPPTFDTSGTFSNPVNGLLEPTNPSGSIVRIDSGIGMVQGYFYLNDADVDFDIASDLGNANATDLIVLRRDTSSPDVRLARIKGAAGSTAVVTQNSTTWEVELAQVVLTAGGDFSSLVDRRRVSGPGVGTRCLINQDVNLGGSGSIAISNIPPIFNNLILELYGATDGVSGNNDNIQMSFNIGGAGLHDYNQQFVDGNGSLAGTLSSGASFAQNVSDGGYLPNSNSATDTADGLVYTFFNYANTDLHKVVQVLGSLKGTNAAANTYNYMISNWIRDTGAITSITLNPVGSSFVDGSRYALYGTI